MGKDGFPYRRLPTSAESATVRCTLPDVCGLGVGHLGEPASVPLPIGSAGSPSLRRVHTDPFEDRTAKHFLLEFAGV